ncbi:MAG: transporter [Candidatus Cyclobacteriaceae bacterium M3_2C_046]
MIQVPNTLKYFVCLALLLISSSVNAQEDWESINTDRPGQGTDSPLLLPLGAIQLEHGVYFQSDRTVEGIKTNSWLIPTGLVRLGVLKNLELRAGYGFIHEEITGNDQDTNQSGLDALSLGAKVFITEQQGILPQLALIASFTLPGTGNESFQSDYLAPAIRILAGHSINDWLAITTNFDFNWDQELTQAIMGYAMSFDLSLSQKMGGFAEFYGYFPEISPAQHLFNAGLVYLIHQNLQLDTSASFAFSEPAPDYFLSLGLSYRFRLF